MSDHDHKDDRDTTIIPEPTDFDTARRDGVAERIASGDTEGGADQFTGADRDRDRESLVEEGDRTLRSGQEGAGQDKAANDAGGSQPEPEGTTTGGGGGSSF